MGQSKPYALCLARRPMLALMERQKRSRKRPWRDGERRGPVEPGRQGSRTDSLLAVSSSTSLRTGDQAWRWANLFSVKLRFVGESNICLVFLRRAVGGLIGQGLQGEGTSFGAWTRFGQVRTDNFTTHLSQSPRSLSTSISHAATD